MREVKKTGFTLIELLIVISIIAILTGLLLVNFNAVRERSHDLKRKSELDQLKRALQLYKNDYSLFPATGTDDVIKACTSLTEFAWGTQFVCNSIVYMRSLPKDPSSPDKEIHYQQVDNGQGYCLWVTLDNLNDEAIDKSQANCDDCTMVDVSDYVVCPD